MAKSLVIVESPAKARTISKYLGAGFEVKASVGHIIDLPPNKMGVDLSFMRSTSDMTQNISLIGAGGNILAGNQMKKKLEDARKRLKKLINNPKSDYTKSLLESSINWKFEKE